ncbi:MAG: PaaI family thioesterase [Sphingobium sp.]|nr:MAG: PaaI family thioesterase [Sphingobium sp.]
MKEGKWAGWAEWPNRHPNTFHDAIGQSRMRIAGPNKAVVALETRDTHRNRNGVLHGGFLAAFADHAFFAGLLVMGHEEHINGVTIDLSMQYLNAGAAGPDLWAEVELLRETGRLFFLRMLILQEGKPVAASTATVRKAPVSR